MATERGQVAFRNRSVSQSRFAMVPRADVPRSRFVTEHSHKTTFNASQLVPVYVEEVLPGDHFRVSMTAFARMATPLFPVMDNFHLSSFFFFVPNRLVWTNWVKFMGEQLDPADSIEYVVPTLTLSAVAEVGSLFDYMGIPTDGQAIGVVTPINALPFRAYQLIYNEWFRDENLIARWTDFGSGDGPDVISAGTGLRVRGKRHDYFTSCLPWPQKGTEVTIPLGGLAPVQGLGVSNASFPVGPVTPTETGGVRQYDVAQRLWDNGVDLRLVPDTQSWYMEGTAASGGTPAIYADLSAATAQTINALRLAFQTQKLLERDARGGTRYVELLLAHFGVQPQDARLQRPEYLGGGSSPVVVSPIAQQSATGLTGGSSPLGALGGVGTGVARHSFSYSAAEHGFILGIVSVQADLTYQQGLRRLYSRRTRYDYYWPAFAHLGEQAVLRKEIFFTGEAANDEVVFGYQERWAEYRYHPSEISGRFRSTAAGNIDEWHAAQVFSSAPTLNNLFIRDDVPMARILAAGAAADEQQFLFDSVFSASITRPMPTYSVPGFIDRF